MKIWISVSTFNRKKITEIVLKQLGQYKGDSFLHVSDDHSTDYTLTDLQSFSNIDLIEKAPRKMGIHQLRCWELQQFLKTDFDLCYLTDNDAYHDPNYVNRLKDLYDRYKLPTSLYNTRWHFNSTIRQDGDVVIRKTIPGISQLYDRQMVVSILKNINIPSITYAWDYIFIDALKMDTVTSSVSYIEHAGINGIHNPGTDFERDRAYNPTLYLQQVRGQIINSLLNGNLNSIAI